MKKLKIRIYSRTVQGLSFAYTLVSSTTFVHTLAIFSVYPTYKIHNGAFMHK